MAGSDLEIGRLARHEQRLRTLPLHGLGFVRGPSPCSHRRIECRQQGTEAEHLRCQCTPEALARRAVSNDASATLSNLGAFGVDRFEAILNPPQSVIVAVGRIAKRPVVENDQVVARLTMPVSLSVDHRVVDGVPAAAFLQTLIGILESPEATYNEWE